MKPKNRTVELSVIIPVLNEEQCIPGLLSEINAEIECGAIPLSTEIIFVDDGSTDATLMEIERAPQTYPDLNIRVMRHNRTFGQTQALALGFQQSRGDIVVALDGDGQNDPADISLLIEKQRVSGVDCVSGWRSERNGDRGLRIGFSKIANAMLMKASGVAIHDSGCTLKAYRGKVIRSVPLFGDMHRIIPFQIEALGGTIAEIPVSHRRRTAGKSKYSLGRTFRVLQDIIVVYFVKRFMLRPMHLLGSLGGLVLLIGVIGFFVAVGLRLFGIFDLVETPALLISSVLGIGGLNMMGIGLIAEMLNRRAGSNHTLPHPLGWTEQ